MFDPSMFTVPVAKPLPIILLLDISGSMYGEKINTLNSAVQEMLETFVEEERRESEFLVSVITFGKEVKLQLPYTKASKVQWVDLCADGMTPMGTALRMAKAMIEEKGLLPSPCYKPIVVLVSDGQPTDKWDDALKDFVEQGRSSKCDRLAVAIGDDADEAILATFLTGTENEILFAEDASNITECFKKITVTATMRATSGGQSAPRQATRTVSPRQTIQATPATPKPAVPIDPDDDDLMF